MLDLILKTGQVVTGENKPGEILDIGIQGDRIVAVKNRCSERACRTLHLEGRTVFPGFIDMHSHLDLAALRREHETCTILQGITTAVLGNCGFSVFPCSAAFQDEAVSFLQLLFPGANASCLCEHASRFAERLGESVINEVPFVGHNMLRLAVNGNTRLLSDEQLETMCELADQECRRGVYGVSTGLLYPPASFARTEELIRLAAVVVRHGAVLSCHLRCEGHHMDESLAEAIEVAKKTGVELQISHLKLAGVVNWGKMRALLREIARANRQGCRISFDIYPYLFGHSTLLSLLPAKATEGSLEVAVRKLRNPSQRTALKTHLQSADSLLATAGPENIVVASCTTAANQCLVGMNLREIAQQRRMEVVDVVCDLLVAEKGKGTIFLHLMCENDVREALRHPLGMLGTDGIPVQNGLAHPRLTSTFPRFLARYVLCEDGIPLEKAVAKMASMAARKLRLIGRGAIRPGFFADLAVFDLEQLKSAVFSGQILPGAEYVIINGKLAVENGRFNGARAGRCLLRER